MDSHEIFVENKLRKAASLIKPNSLILDIGCGDGKISSFLQGSEYYAVDIDKTHVNNLLKQNIKAKQADLNKEEIPFRNKKFDYVLLLDILEHVVNPRALLEQAKLRLNQNGMIIATLPNDYHILNKIRFVFNKHLTSDPFSSYGHLHYFPIKSGESFLLQSNLKILKKIPIAPVKPAFIPQSIKEFLTKLSPQSFSRDVLYVLSA